MSECLFVAGSLGSGGISEAASMGEQRWRLNAGVLGETALPGFRVCRVRIPRSRVRGTRHRMGGTRSRALTRGFTHAKSAKPRRRSGRRRGTRSGGSMDATGSGEELLKLVVRIHLTTCASNAST